MPPKFKGLNCPRRLVNEWKGKEGARILDSIQGMWFYAQQSCHVVFNMQV